MPRALGTVCHCLSSGAGTRLPRDCKWISSLELVLLVGRGLEASGWLNDSFWRAKTHGVHHAANAFTSKKRSLFSLMHIEREKMGAPSKIFLCKSCRSCKKCLHLIPDNRNSHVGACWVANLARDSKFAGRFVFPFFLSDHQNL